MGPAKDGPRDVRLGLLAWYDRERRDLPWRRSRDPYAIWVSEIMLQQTRVETAAPYFERFLDRFPDVASLAATPLDEVLTLWSGLGLGASPRCSGFSVAASRSVLARWRSHCAGCHSSARGASSWRWMCTARPQVLA